jgi:hypothetical protein
MDIVTVNLGNKAHNVTALQQRLQTQRLARRRPDVIVTQESRSGWVTPTGYRLMPVILPGAREDLIAVRKDRRVIGHGYVRMHPGKRHQWPARSMPFVTIDRGDSAPPLWVVGAHVNSSIEAGGALVATGERRLYAVHHIETLADFGHWVDVRMQADCVVVGDFNVDAYADRRMREREFPTRRFAAAGLHEALPAQRSGTLGSRRVDRVFHTDRLSVSVLDLPRRKPYDHQPVSVKVR